MKLSGPVASIGGPSVMNVPAPWRACTTPIADERLQPGPHRGAADADLHRQLALGRQAIARPQLAALDQRPDVRDHVLGRDAIRAGARRRRTGTRRPASRRLTAFVSLAIGVSMGASVPETVESRP